MTSYLKCNSPMRAFGECLRGPKGPQAVDVLTGFAPIIVRRIQDIPERGDFSKVLLRAYTLLLFLTVLLTPPAICVTDSVEELMQKADVAQKAGNEDAAAALYREVLRIRPRWGPAEYNLGLMLALQDQYADAIKLFTLALEDDPSLVAAYLFRGIAYFNLGQPKDALPSLQQYLRVRPSDGQVRFFLGGTYYALGDYLNGAQQYLAQIEITPRQEDLYYYLGECYLAMGREARKTMAQGAEGKYFLWLTMGEEQAQEKDTSLAEQSIREAIKLNPAASDAYVRLGNIFLLEGKPIEAKAQFGEALKREPQDCHALEGVGDAELAMGNVVASMTKYGVVARSRRLCIEEPPPENLGLSPIEFGLRLKSVAEYLSSPKWQPDATFELARLGYGASEDASHTGTAGPEKGRNVSAMSRENEWCFTPTESREPLSQPQALLSLASCREMNDDLRGAISALVATRQGTPLDFRAAYWAFRLYMRLAQRAFSSLAALSPGSYLLAEIRAELLEMRGRDEEAESEYKKAIALSGRDPNPLIEYGRFKCKLSQLDQAISILKEALVLAPYNARTNALIGEAYYMENEFAAAVPCLQIVIRANPDNEDSRIHLAQSLAKLGRTNEGITLLEAAPSDSDGRIHFVLARYYGAQGRKEDMERALAIFAKRQKEIKDRRVQTPPTK
jgi:tetratricopeptide (TPR) repeat protein